MSKAGVFYFLSGRAMVKVEMIDFILDMVLPITFLVENKFDAVLMISLAGLMKVIANYKKIILNIFVHLY